MSVFTTPLGIFGAVEIGVLLSSLLYGATLVQTYIYALSCEKDRRAFKIIVFAIWVLETIHLIFTWIYFFKESVQHFGDKTQLNEVGWDFDIALIAHALFSPSVQAFFNYRVYVLSKKFWLALPGWILAVIRPAVIITMAVLFGLEGIVVFKQKHEWIMYLSFSLTVSVDVWTASILIWLLWHKRSTYRSSIDRVNGVMIWTMETGLATSLSAIVTVVFYALPENGIWVGTLLVYGRLYFNSLLVSLNARDAYKRKSPSGWGDMEYEMRGSKPIVLTRSVNIEMSDIETLPPIVKKRQHSADHCSQENQVEKGLAF